MWINSNSHCFPSLSGLPSSCLPLLLGAVSAGRDLIQTKTPPPPPCKFTAFLPCLFFAPQTLPSYYVSLLSYLVSRSFPCLPSFLKGMFGFPAFCFPSGAFLLNPLLYLLTVHPMFPWALHALSSFVFSFPSSLSCSILVSKGMQQKSKRVTLASRALTSLLCSHS